jgi:hypothetical protein
MRSQLAVHWDGQRVGRIAVSRRERFCIFGTFVPEAGFEVCRAAFEAAQQGDAEYASAVAAGSDPFQTSRQRFYDAVAALSARASLPEVGGPVEEFNVFADGMVEVYLPGHDV